jgi:hypothetical protein
MFICMAGHYVVTSTRLLAHLQSHWGQQGLEGGEQVRMQTSCHTQRQGSRWECKHPIRPGGRGMAGNEIIPSSLEGGEWVGMQTSHYTWREGSIWECKHPVRPRGRGVGGNAGPRGCAAGGNAGPKGSAAGGHAKILSVQRQHRRWECKDPPSLGGIAVGVNAQIILGPTAL